ncbi:ArsR/SmtB family transcription factor [Kitasatospora sp. NPDC018619]|uniref:ArsR/SmtB family transcription factor n=1 Tax=unclassified Kitasatospora TaxID=2633591 RepID=UPI0037A85276
MEDLVRVRVAGPPTAEAEAAFALDNWSKNSGGYFRRWHQAVTNSVRSREELQRRIHRFELSGRTIWHLLGAPPPQVDDPSEPLARIPARTVGEDPSAGPDALVQEFGTIAVLPYWQAIHARLVRDTDAYRQIMSASGVETLLQALHPRVHWRAPVLEVEDDQDETIELRGRGLVITPSLFLTAPAVVPPHATVVKAEPAPALVFPVRPDSRGDAVLGAREAERPLDSAQGEALASLVGKTRAALLEALLNGSTNGELADRVGVSNAAVSQHTSVLRAAGLIATRRTRNLVLHTVTPLGRSLLNGGTRFLANPPGTAPHHRATPQGQSVLAGR